MSTTSIPVSPELHERAKALKRGGESWSDLLQKMVDQYDPDAANGGERRR